MLTLKKCDVLSCLFLEVRSGSLAGLAFKAGNKMPALLVMQLRARGSLPQGSDLAGDIVSMELCWPSLAHSDRGCIQTQGN